jgi:transcriptional regulator with XRE-family HTH domain
MQRFKERLVARRNSLNLSQVELAEKSGVSPRSIASYESGESRPTSSMLDKLAGALGVPPSWLLGADNGSLPAHIPREDPVPYRVATVDLGVLREEQLKAMLNNLADDLKEAAEPARGKIVEAINAIHQEMRVRAGKRRKLISSAGVDAKADAEAVVDAAEEQADRERGYSPKPATDVPNAQIPSPRPNASKASKAQPSPEDPAPK